MTETTPVPPALRTRYEARHLLEACAPYDPVPGDDRDVLEGTLRGGLHYLKRLRAQLPELARKIHDDLVPPEHDAGAVLDLHPAEVLELAHPPAYHQVLHQVQRIDAEDEQVVTTATELLARAWEHTLMATGTRLAPLAGVEAELRELDHDLREEQERADELLRASRSLQYLSAGHAARFADCYVDVARELVSELLTEGNEVHGRVVVGLPKGSELMGAGWVPEATGTVRLWFKRAGEEYDHPVGAQAEAILATVEQTHRPTFGLARYSGPKVYDLVVEWLRRARELIGPEPEVAPDEERSEPHALLDDLDATLRGYPRG